MKIDSKRFRVEQGEKLLLHNLIARSSVLLHRAAQALGTGTVDQREALIIETEAYFRESRREIMEAVNSLSKIPLPAKRFIPPPPPPVINVGWAAPKKDFEPSEPGALDYFLK
jgi:hypothetical protein